MNSHTVTVKETDASLLRADWLDMWRQSLTAITFECKS